jgi:hypothetical protein
LLFCKGAIGLCEILSDNFERLTLLYAFVVERDLPVIDSSHKGREFPEFQYTIERGKVREFLIAIGDDGNKAFAENAVIPPTFPTVFVFWGGLNLEDVLDAIGVKIWNVLHAEQEYEYLNSIHVGDTVTGRLQIADIYTRGAGSAQLEFVELLIEYTNQSGQPVLGERNLILVRDANGGAE